VTAVSGTRASQGGRRGGGGRGAPPPASVLGCAIALIAGPPRDAGAAGAPRPAHPTPESVTRVLALGPHAGACDACHTQHAWNQPGPYEHALIGPDENTLCDGCHSVPWNGGSYGGTLLYAGAPHGSSANVVWPGPDPPARTEANAARKCLNCHDAHGQEDATGLIPFLSLKREENLCLTCHDGSPAQSNVRTELLKPFNHPVTIYTGRHAGPLESSPADFAVTPINQRHSECEDCHNPHVSRNDGALPPPPPAASKLLLGVSRVSVLNSAAGTPPSYTFLAGADTLTAPVTEYQLCFKCHSSWTVQPTGQTDLALVLNPANPSYHPVEAAGPDPGISPMAFAPGWSAASLTACGDCHGSEMGTRAPHGSIYRYILRQPYTASSAPRAMTSNELCFRCHAYDVYGNSSSPAALRQASRFNAPGATMGHAEHVGDQQVSCYACHVTHGSGSRTHLIVTGRSPGLLTFAETASGGTCTTACHPSQSYTVNYAR